MKFLENFLSFKKPQISLEEPVEIRLRRLILIPFLHFNDFGDYYLEYRVPGKTDWKHIHWCVKREYTFDYYTVDWESMTVFCELNDEKRNPEYLLELYHKKFKTYKDVVDFEKESRDEYNRLKEKKKLKLKKIYD